MKNKTVAIVLLVIILALAIIASFSDTIGKNGAESVIFTDSSGVKFALVSYDGKNETIKADDDGYCDYIKIALEEAIALYTENAENIPDDAKNSFFSKISSVSTNFDSFYYEKIKAGFGGSDLEEDTPFAGVMVDGKGRVLATYGTVEESGKNYSLNKTYAGSAIKPLSVYAPAIEKKIIHWSSQIKDAPIKKVKTESEGIKGWPSNANGIYTNENMLVCDALYKSVNTVAVRVLKRTDINTSVDFLSNKLGLNIEAEKRILEIEDDDEIYGNIALGYLIDGVSPLEMAGYYQIFMNGGKYTQPYAVTALTDKDGKNTGRKPKTERVLSTETAFVMAKLLEGVVGEGGTGKAAAVRGVTLGGKSGTSDNYYDNWFIGFSNKIVCSVWHGFNDQPKNSASAIFGSIMEQFPESDGKIPFSKNVLSTFYCNRSGKLKGKKCYDTSVGYYLKGSMPSVCNECGK